jgi:alanyl aminopeptidase
MSARLLLAVATLALARAALAAEAVPTGRLPRDVVPRRHALTLALDPAQTHFSGDVRIALRLAKPTQTLWLHGKNLELTQASVTPRGAKPLPAKAAIVHESGVLQVTTAQPIPAGEAELALSFRTPFDAQLDGTYKVTVAGRPYVMTQFEPLSARKSFPCFDEPSFKTPWDVTLVVPQDAVALANTRLRSETKLADGKRRLVFATTEPLPSYLIAYVVGPWDLREAPPLPPTPQREASLPLRAVAIAGRGEELQTALDATPRAVAELEAYFDLAYPFDKLDLVAAPDFAFGAMENAGLILYQERLLLLGERSPTAIRQDFLVTHVHELAHQWFGNLVTMPWWNDIWLNEAFATWLSVKLVNRMEPSYHAALHELEGVIWAAGEDSLASARRIAEPVNDYRDVVSAFDGITYQKGGAVLDMFESYLGEERFRDAIRRHVRAHVRGNATSEDLVRAIAAASDDAKATEAAFRSFLDQPGIPLVEAAVQCDEDGARLDVAQRRYLPYGSTAKSAQTWGIPLCVRMAVDGKSEKSCALVTQARQSVTLGKTCPSWVMPNAGASGYYRFALAASDRAKLDAGFASLSDREQLVTADALSASFRAGVLGADDFVRAAAKPAASPSWPVASAPLETLEWIRDHLADARERSALDAFLRATYGPRLAKLGIDERAGEPDEAKLEREALLGVLARAGDTELRRELTLRARRAFDGERFAAERLPGDMRADALSVLAQDGDAAEFAALQNALAQETDGQVRRDLVRAIASAQRPERAERARSLATTDAIRSGELDALLETHFQWEENRAAAKPWFRANADALLGKAPALWAAYLPFAYATDACSEAEAKEVESAFGAKVAKLEGGPRAMQQLVEGVRLCAALRAHQEQRGFGAALSR